MCFAPAAQTVRGASSSPSAHYSGSIKDPIVGLNLVFVKDGVLERTWPVVQASPMLDSHRINTDYKRYHSAYYRWDNRVSTFFERALSGSLLPAFPRRGWRMVRLWNWG